uniref:Vacuolar protein sorting-associated protein 41 n=1 Tax=Strongyloides stercoralis TaxID=6248 RepID=A0A0K0EPK9_STRER
MNEQKYNTLNIRNNSSSQSILSNGDSTLSESFNDTYDNYNGENSSVDDTVFADEEPRLNYERIIGDLGQCFSSQSPTAVTFSDKFIAAGFKMGYILLFDYSGLGHKEIPTRKHNTKIISLSFDDKSDYLGSLSSDGMLSVFGLVSSNLNVILNLKEIPTTICLAPDYSIQGKGAKLVIGGRSLYLYKKGLLSGKFDKIYGDDYMRGGIITTISWKKNILAFTNCEGTRIYDFRINQIVTRLDVEPNISRSPLLTYQPVHLWLNDKTLIVGWLNCLTYYKMKEHNIVKGIEVLKKIEITKNYKLEGNFMIAGISYMQNDLLSKKNPELILYGMYKNEGISRCGSVGSLNAPPPSIVTVDGENFIGKVNVKIIKSLTKEDFIVTAEDIIDMNGVLPNQLHRLKMFGIPYDKEYYLLGDRCLIKAIATTLNERLDWRMENDLLFEAVDFAKQYQSLLDKESVIHVGRKLMEKLLRESDYITASDYLSIICNKDKSEWKYMFNIYRMEGILYLFSYAMSSDKPILEKEYYQEVIEDALNKNATIFRKIVETWDKNLYNYKDIIEKLKIILAKLPKDNTPEINVIRRHFLLSMARLSTYDKDYELAADIYIKACDKFIFNWIGQNNAYSVIKERLPELMNISKYDTIQLIFDNEADPKTVLYELRGIPDYQLDFLLALFERGDGAEYGNLAVELFVRCRKEKLLHFLQTNDNYIIREATNICRREKMYEELIYLLSRSGFESLKEAIEIIVNEFNDINRAIRFCKENHGDGELWGYLLSFCNQTPQIVKDILEEAGTSIDPLTIVENIDEKLEIPELTLSLIRLIKACEIEIDNMEIGLKILTNDINQKYDSCISKKPVFVDIVPGVNYDKPIAVNFSESKNSYEEIEDF